MSDGKEETSTAVQRAITARPLEGAPTIECGRMVIHVMPVQSGTAAFQAVLHRARRNDHSRRLHALLLAGSGVQRPLVVLALGDFINWKHNRPAADGLASASANLSGHQEV